VCERGNDSVWAGLVTRATCSNAVDEQNAEIGDETIRRHGVHAEIQIHYYVSKVQSKGVRISSQQTCV